MNKLEIIIAIIIIYLTLVFVIPLLFFPGFLREVKIQRTEKIKVKSKELKSENKKKTLENVFNYVKKRYHESNFKLFILLNRHFYTDVDKVLEKKEIYLPCHVQSLVLKTLLINTQQFEEKDFRKRIVMTLGGTIHEYYLIRVNDKIFEADPYYGILKELK